MIRRNVSYETVFLCVRGNVGKDVFTRRYCMWKLRGVDVYKRQLYNIMIEIKNDKELREKFAVNGPVWGQNFKSEIIWEGMNELYKA